MTETSPVCTAAQRRAQRAPADPDKFTADGWLRTGDVASVEFIDAVPRTSTGKFWKMKLRERFAGVSGTPRSLTA